jgi:tRNA modification GTPase
MPHVRTSALTGQGVQSLKDLWRESLEKLLPSPTADTLIVNARHANCLLGAQASLNDAINLLREEAGVELALSDMRSALEELGEIVGGVDNEDMLDRLFQSFCIGK